SQYLRFDTWVTRAKPGDGLTVYFNGKLIGVVSLDTVTAGFFTHFFPPPHNPLGDVRRFTFTPFNRRVNPLRAPALLDNVSFGILKLLPPAPGGDSQSDRPPLLQWKVLTGEQGTSKVYVSTFPAGSGLFPSDTPPDAPADHVIND